MWGLLWLELTTPVVYSSNLACSQSSVLISVLESSAGQQIERPGETWALSTRPLEVDWRADGVHCMLISRELQSTEFFMESELKVRP